MENIYYVTLIDETGFKRKSVEQAETKGAAIIKALDRLDERTYWSIDRTEVEEDKGNV